MSSSDPLIPIAQEFDLTPDAFRTIVEEFQQEYNRGLNDATGATMIPSFVTRLPTGDERGTFLALDIGGTHLRVSAVHLLGEGHVQVTEVRRTISDALRTTSVPVFFDWIADAVAQLLRSLDNVPRPLAMGVCWSFPLNQTSISSGTILRMGKGFTLTGIEGQDLTSLFRDAFKRKKLNIHITALLNDTVGTLVAHAYSNPQVSAGFIYGTGVNAAYPEKISRIVKLQQPAQENEKDSFMLVNTEIDLFGNSAYLPLTRFDKQLDQNHPQPNFQIYEKMVSGAYLGELTRLVAVELITQHNYLFDGRLPTLFQQPWAFTTTLMGEIEGAETDQERLAQAKKWLDPDIHPTIQDMRRLYNICQMVSSRAARLAAAAIASLIEQQSLPDNEPIVIGVNGSTFEKYPHMPERIEASLQSWFGQDAVSNRIHLEVATDGGSIGAALVAMLYQEDTCSKSRKKPTCISPFTRWTRRAYKPLKRWIAKTSKRKQKTE